MNPYILEEIKKDETVFSLMPGPLALQETTLSRWKPYQVTLRNPPSKWSTWLKGTYEEQRKKIIKELRRLAAAEYNVKEDRIVIRQRYA